MVRSKFDRLFPVRCTNGTVHNKIVNFEQEGLPGEKLRSNIVFQTFNVVDDIGSGYENGSGRVFAFCRSSTSEYASIKEPLVGHPGDCLLAEETINRASSGNENDLILVISTATGSVITYVFNASMNSWRPHFATLSLDPESSVVLVYYDVVAPA